MKSCSELLLAPTPFQSSPSARLWRRTRARAEGRGAARFPWPGQARPAGGLRVAALNRGPARPCKALPGPARPCQACNYCARPARFGRPDRSNSSCFSRALDWDAPHHCVRPGPARPLQCCSRAIASAARKGQHRQQRLTAALRVPARHVTPVGVFHDRYTLGEKINSARRASCGTAGPGQGAVRRGVVRIGPGAAQRTWAGPGRGRHRRGSGTESAIGEGRKKKHFELRAAQTSWNGAALRCVALLCVAPTGAERPDGRQPWL